MPDFMEQKVKDDPTYRPYCGVCSTMARMAKRDYGFQCVACQNTIKNDMTHYDPPENNDERT